MRVCDSDPVRDPVTASRTVRRRGTDYTRLSAVFRLVDDITSRDDFTLEEAYRRLASVTTDEEVDDIRTEWEDRYGQLPPPADALLAVARLRAEAARTGLREITVVKPSSFGGAPSTARLSPMPLKASQQIRLKRLHPTAV